MTKLHVRVDGFTQESVAFYFFGPQRKPKDRESEKRKKLPHQPQNELTEAQATQLSIDCGPNCKDRKQKGPEKKKKNPQPLHGLPARRGSGHIYFLPPFIGEENGGQPHYLSC